MCARYPSDFANFSEDYKDFLAKFMLAQMDSFEFGDQVERHWHWTNWHFIPVRALAGSSGPPRRRRTAHQSGISSSFLSRASRLQTCARGIIIAALTRDLGGWRLIWSYCIACRLLFKVLLGVSSWDNVSPLRKVGKVVATNTIDNIQAIVFPRN